MPTKLKAQQLTSRLQFTACLDEAAALQLDIETRTAALNERLSGIELPEKKKIEDLQAQLNAKLVVAEAFAEAHKDELLPENRKSGETARATWGFRKNPASLKQIGRAWTVARSLEALIEGYKALKTRIFALRDQEPESPELPALTAEAELMQPMVRQKLELNKDAIKDAWKDDTAKLKAYGFKLEEEDEFWVEPKRAVETAAA